MSYYKQSPRHITLVGFWKRHFDELGQQLAASRTYGDAWAWTDDAKELRDDLNATIRQQRQDVERYTNFAADSDLELWGPMAERHAQNVEALVSMREDITDALRQEKVQDLAESKRVRILLAEIEAENNLPENVARRAQVAA